jgi:ADP-ribose pyrophosphatase YjhB (NUDIX family)
MPSDHSASAAVSLIEQDGKLLCVYNRRYHGWSLPGGKVEPGESVEQAQERELREETGLSTLERSLVFSGPHGLPVDEGRARMVHVFRVRAEGQARMMEPGCPVSWRTRKEFLACSPFSDLYERVFEVIGHAGPVLECGHTEAEHRLVSYDRVSAYPSEMGPLEKNAAYGRQPSGAPYSEEVENLHDLLQHQGQVLEQALEVIEELLAERGHKPMEAARKRGQEFLELMRAK